MNILICVNKKYIDKAVIMLRSLKKHTPNVERVYLLNSSLKSTTINSFRQQIEKIGLTLYTVSVPENAFDQMTVGGGHFTKEIYYRIIAQFLLPVDVDRVLWLDADIIIQKNLSSFYNQDFEDNYMVVCQDAKWYSKGIIQLKKKLGLPENHLYFNSGVLLINLEKLRRETTIDNVIDSAKALEPLVLYPDQDILNCLYNGKVKYDSWWIYNYQILKLKMPPDYDIRDAAILHFTSGVKPWHYSRKNEAACYWWNEVYNQQKALKATLYYVKTRGIFEFRRFLRRLLNRF